MNHRFTRRTFITKGHRNAFVSMALVLAMLVGMIASASITNVASASQSGAKCTITYDLNGGEYSSGDLTQSFTVGSPVELKTPKLKAREGCWLIGFSETGRNDTTVYTRDSIATNFKGDVTLYAVWTPRKEGATNCTITYVLNGGNLKSGSLSQSFKAGETVTIKTPKLISNNGFYKEGYYLKGYTTGNGKIYKDGMTTQDFNDNVVLYAEWVPVSSNNEGASNVEVKYTVTYNLNGGTVSQIDSSTIVKDSVVAGKSVKVKGGYYYPGKTLAGWAETPTGTKICIPNSNFTPQKDITLYAVWETKGYTIKMIPFESGVSSTEIEVKPGSYVTYEQLVEWLNCEPYYHIEFYTDKSCSKNISFPTQVYGNKELYYDTILNGGYVSFYDGDKQLKGPEWCYPGYLINQMLRDPRSKGKIFLGWSTEEDGWNKPNVGVYRSDHWMFFKNNGEEIKLYAQWMDVDKRVLHVYFRFDRSSLRQIQRGLEARKILAYESFIDAANRVQDTKCDMIIDVLHSCGASALEVLGEFVFCETPVGCFLTCCGMLISTVQAAWAPYKEYNKVEDYWTMSQYANEWTMLSRELDTVEGLANALSTFEEIVLGTTVTNVNNTEYYYTLD